MLYLDHPRTLTGDLYLPRVPCDDRCVIVDFGVGSDVPRGSCLTAGCSHLSVALIGCCGLRWVPNTRLVCRVGSRAGALRSVDEALHNNHNCQTYPPILSLLTSVAYSSALPYLKRFYGSPPTLMKLQPGTLHLQFSHDRVSSPCPLPTYMEQGFPDSLCNPHRGAREQILKGCGCLSCGPPRLRNHCQVPGQLWLNSPGVHLLALIHLFPLSNPVI